MCNFRAVKVKSLYQAQYCRLESYNFTEKKSPIAENALSCSILWTMIDCGRARLPSVNLELGLGSIWTLCDLELGLQGQDNC